MYFDELHTTRIGGFPATSPAETILCLAGRLSVSDLEGVVEDQLSAGAITIGDFDPLFIRSAGGRVRGITRLAEILDIRRPDAWQPHPNQIEALLGDLVDHPDIPPATPQVPLPFDDRPMIVDIFVSEWGLILEADGRRYHTRVADFERDRHRDNLAAANGLVVLRYTWSMLTNDFTGCRRQLIETGRRRSVA